MKIEESEDRREGRRVSSDVDGGGCTGVRAHVQVSHLVSAIEV